MNSDRIKKAVKVWADRVGSHVAHKELVKGDLSLAVTQKLVAGSYEPGLSHDNALKILKVLRQQGISLADDKAS